MNENNQVNAMQAMNCSVQGQNIVGLTSVTSGTANMQYSTTTGYDTQQLIGGSTGPSNTLWAYWQGPYYEQVIYPSYPVYIREKAMDKGKQAFEILKALMDKDLIKVEKVKDFVEAMDTILRTL